MPTTQTFGALRGPLVDKDGNPSRDFLKKLQEYETKLANTITLVGKIASGAVIQGRSEGIGTTVGNLTSAGQVNALTNVLDDSTFRKTAATWHPENMIQDPGFESTAIGSTPHDWTSTGGMAVVVTPGQSGDPTDHALQTPMTSGFQGARTIQYPCIPGETYLFGGSFKTGGTGTWNAYFEFWKTDHVTQITNIAKSIGAPIIWTSFQQTLQVPANAYYLDVAVINGSGIADQAVIDNVFLRKIRTAQDVTPLNTAGTPRSTTGLCTQHGAGLSQIDVASSIWQFGFGTVAYNSGSCDPSVTGKFTVTGDDINYAGGAILYVPRATPADANLVDGRLSFGNITTAAGVATSTGAGSGGGGPVSKAALAF